jgi:hypothetical protein
VSHLAEAWRLARTASGGGGVRFQHFFLPDDPDEAHRALVHLSRTGMRHRAVDQAHGEYEQGRLHDLVANEGFSHHPVHGAAPSHGFMASYHAPEGSGIAPVHHISEIGPEHIAAHRQAIGEHLKDPSTYQGGWHDTATGDVYLDASKHHTDEHAVRDFAGGQKQKAYFHLGDFTERFMHPKQDPLAMKDHDAWKDRYKDVGTEPHPAFKSYAHLYPHTDEQKKFWGDRGEHLGAREKRDTPMAGRPIGGFRSPRNVQR